MCYDRMAHAIISLCTQQLGMPQQVINFLLQTIQQMCFYLRTGFGDSDHFYGGPSEMPLQGCCQENGGSPAMWVSVTIPLVEDLHRQGHTAQLRHAYLGRSVNTAGNVYVDDVDLVSFGFDSEEPFANVLSRAQGMV